VEISDRKLIEWLKTSWTEIAFVDASVKHPRVARAEKIRELVAELSTDDELHKQKPKLSSLWSLLIGSAIVYLKSKDTRETHHDDGDYGTEILKRYFDNFCEFERFLYGSSEHYRDHVSHMFRVFLLGEYLLRTKAANSRLTFSDLRTGEEVLGGKQGSSITAEEKEAMWCLMALTHDLGYPLEVLHSINSQVRGMVSPLRVDINPIAVSQQSGALNDLILKMLSSNVVPEKGRTANRFRTTVQTKYLVKFLRAQEEHDHGIESCILLFKALVFFLETDYCLDSRKTIDRADARQFLIRQQILRAIASHHCNSIYHLKMLDISFLLRIIDEMQEWGRPRLASLFEVIPDTRVEIDKLQANEFGFKVRFLPPAGANPSPEDLKRMHHAVWVYFKGKCETFVEILRSAVDGKNRDLRLAFSVSDEVEKHGSKTQFDFYQATPENMSVKRDGVEIDLRGLSSEEPPKS